MAPEASLDTCKGFAPIIMNYLAHLYLAVGSDEFLLGSLLGDFVKGNMRNDYSDAIEQGIIFHRKVDVFADSHSTTVHCKNLFSSKRRRFAGVIVDICYDHFLSKHWSNYSHIELDAFAAHVYTVLQEHYEILPERLQKALPRMRRQNWLSAYGTLKGVEITLNRISKRITRQDMLFGAVNEVSDNYDRLEKNFFAFFPDLIDFARSYCASVDYPSEMIKKDRHRFMD